MLARRAEEFFETCQKDDRAHLKRLFTLRLVHVRLEGEVTRRRARREEYSEIEWRLVEALAGPDWRLLVTGGTGDDATVEVAHEVLLRDWERLGRWLEAERAFLVWKGVLEGDRREWQRTSNDEGALLRGTRLDEAENWLTRRGDELLPDDREFVEASVHARKRERARRHGWVLATVVAVAAIYIAGAQILNLEDGWWSIATPTLLALLAGLLAYTLRLRRQRQRIQRALGHYVPLKVAKRFADRATEPMKVQETVYATCLAADAEGFTAIAEGMMPEAAASFLNAYFEALAEPLKRHGADLTQFHADSIMCAWTGPRPDPTMRSKACLAAVEALEAVRSFNERYAPLHLGVRFGLHTGRVFVGHAGGGGQFNYGILGDIANTASRIEQLNKQLGTRLLATEDVVADLENILVRPLGDFTFAGKRSHVSVFEILSATGSATMAQLSLCGRFRLAIDAFRGERWDEAESRFREILHDYPDDGPARFYLDRASPEARRRASVEAGDAS